MDTASTFRVTLPSDLEIAMSRAFKAPRQLVFDAHTRPELLMRWYGGPRGWNLVECEVQLRVGGRWHYLLRNDDGEEMGFGGEYLEVDPPARIASTDEFDDPWYEGRGITATTFEERDGLTVVTISARYDSKAIRDTVLQSGMDSGVATGFDRLEEFLATLE